MTSSLPIVSLKSAKDVEQEEEESGKAKSGKTVVIRPFSAGSQFSFEFKGDEEAEYSFTPYSEVLAIVQKFKAFAKEHNVEPKALYDATSNVVGPILFGLSKAFSAVHGTELDPSTFKMLEENLALAEVKGVSIENANAMDKLEPGFLAKYPMVFFDPPWGGKGYRAVKSLDLFLSYKGKNYHISEVADRFLKHAKVVAIKVPTNFNISSIKNDIYAKLDIKRPYKGKDEVSYYVLFLYNKEEEDLGQDAPDVSDVQEAEVKEAKGSGTYVEKFFGSKVFPLHSGHQKRYKLVASEDTAESTLPYDTVTFLAQKSIQVFESLIISERVKTQLTYPTLYLQGQGPVTPFLFVLTRFFSDIYAAGTDEELALLKKNLNGESLKMGPPLPLEEVSKYGCAMFTAKDETELDSALKVEAPILLIRHGKEMKVSKQGKEVAAQPIFRNGFQAYTFSFVTDLVKIPEIMMVYAAPGLTSKDSRILSVVEALLGISLPKEKAAKYASPKNLMRWRKAFVASSASPQYNYEKDEFLGDSILKFIFPRYLMGKVPGLTAREYSDLNQVYTNNIHLSYLSRALRLNTLVTALTFPVYPSQAICADVFESFIGTLWAISQAEGDNGYTVAYQFVKAVYDRFIILDLDLASGNYKSQVHQIMERLKVEETVSKRFFTANSSVSVSISKEDVKVLNQAIEYRNSKEGGKWKLFNEKFSIRGSSHSLSEDYAELLAHGEVLGFLKRHGITMESIADYYRTRSLNRLMASFPFRPLVAEQLKGYAKVKYDIVNDVAKDKILYRLIGIKEVKGKKKEELVSACVWPHKAKGDKDQDPIIALLFGTLQ